MQIETTRVCAAVQRLALARVTEQLAGLGLHTGPGAFWHDRIIEQLKYRPINGGPEKSTGSVIIGGEYHAIAKQPVTADSAPRSKGLGELPEGSVVVALEAEFTKMRTRLKVRVLSTPGDKELRFEEGWVGIGTYSRREATRLLLLRDGSEDVANMGEWEGGARSATALRWASQVRRRGARGRGAVTAR